MQALQTRRDEDQKGEEMNEPLWIYGEDGVEVPVDRTVDLGNILDIEPDDFQMLDGDGNEIQLKLDRKAIWKLKWAFLKSAIKFFFMKVE